MVAPIQSLTGALAMRCAAKFESVNWWGGGGALVLSLSRRSPAVSASRGDVHCSHGSLRWDRGA